MKTQSILQDILRQLRNLIRTGVIVDTDLDTGRCRVQTGGIVTDWLQWLTHRAGRSRSWWAPSVGEQVLILAVGGELDTAFVLPAIFSDDHSAPSASADAFHIAFPDGAVNLGGDFKEFQSAYEAVGTDLFDQQESSLRKLVQTATGYVLKLDGWIQKNKSLATTLGLITAAGLGLAGILGAIGLVAWPVIAGINALIAAAGLLSVAFTTAGGSIVTAIGAISWPVVAIVAAVVAGVLLIRKYWEPISAFFSGVVQGLIAAFSPVGEMFAPLAPIFDSLGQKLGTVWQWFKDLIAPVKATQDTLDGCKNVGVAFGKALADALMLPLNIFNKLRSGLDVVLEKLGIVKKESDTIDNATAKVQPVGQGGGYIPATSSMSGYQAYQPVTAPAGRTYIDQSSPTYEIQVNNGGAPGGQLGNQLQDALEKYEREKRAKARASMMHD